MSRVTLSASIMARKNTATVGLFICLFLGEERTMKASRLAARPENMATGSDHKDTFSINVCSRSSKVLLLLDSILMIVYDALTICKKN